MAAAQLPQYPNPVTYNNGLWIFRCFKKNTFWDLNDFWKIYVKIREIYMKIREIYVQIHEIYWDL